MVSRFIRMIRSKEEANGPRKPKEDRLGRKERAHTSAIPNLKKRWRVENMSLKAYMPFTLQELNTYQNIQ